jgi:hypothetical protein
MDPRAPAATLPGLPARALAYADAIAQGSEDSGISLVSIILFGSAVTGGFVEASSDLDMILVVADGTSRDAHQALRGIVDPLEEEHGFRQPDAAPPGRLESFARRITANERSYFVCTRADLLSGDAARLLGIPRWQALFVDRVVIPSIVSSAATAWGEDLLQRVPQPPIRRVDVIKALYGFMNQILLTAAMYPFVPSATKYAMGTLKRSLHNCYFCYRLRPASLPEEVAFFRERGGPTRTLDRLLQLRAEYSDSFLFVLQCLPALLLLHARTAAENRFPRMPAAPGAVTKR